MRNQEHTDRFATPRVTAFAAREDGAILVFVALLLAVFLGVVALGFDIGQRAATQSELQSFADHVALAAAGELDGNTDAITRAEAAAANLITDSQTFASGAKTLSGPADYTLSFFSALPANDASAMTAATTDPGKAAYVRVSVTPRHVPFSFWGAVDALSGNTTDNPDVGATAVAGFTQYACDITPLMFCLPSPSWKADDHVGEMIDLRTGGQDAAWGPGDFGFLDPSFVKVDPNGPCGGLNPTQAARCVIAAYGTITQCFAQTGVDTETGQKVGLENALFNTRFDIYSSVMSGYQNQPGYGPAPNVIKGIVPANGSSCINNNPDPSPDTVGMPRDTCLVDGTCTTPRFGDGDWSAGRTTYWQTNYGAASDPFPEATTRYEYYLAEIAAAGGAAATDPILTGRAETGRAICSAHPIPDPSRRVLLAAGVDCAANPLNGNEKNVPVQEFVRLFMTEPVGQDANSPPTQDIWVEVIGSGQGGSGGIGSADGIVHDVVQLYR